MTIDAGKLEEIFRDCLYKDGEDTSNHIKVEGVVNNFGFHPDRVEQHKAEIEAMLLQLPEQFMKSSDSGGWSFLNMCMDKNNRQWTGFHIQQEQLMTLGIAIGKVEILLPRSMWKMLPGGVPYLVVKDTE